MDTKVDSHSVAVIAVFILYFLACFCITASLGKWRGGGNACHYLINNIQNMLRTRGKIVKCRNM